MAQSTESYEERLTVLVVEDTAPLLELIITVLTLANFVVLQATTGPEALGVAGNHQGKIDLLLSDVRLPGMTGFQLAEALNQSRPQIRVMLMSAFSGGDLLARNHGWTFLQKPFTAKELLGTINRVLHMPA